MPGVTRDLISAEVDKDYMLLERRYWNGVRDDAQADCTCGGGSGGFCNSSSRCDRTIVDARSGITALDEMVAEKLRRYGKSILLVANKVDSEPKSLYLQISLG